MPFGVKEDASACSTSKPWACYNTDTGKIHGCHATREDAIKQQRALYANVPEARMSESYLVSLAFAELGSDLVWLEALPAKTWHTVQYGEVPITSEKLQRMVSNFKSNVRGQDIATDYHHGFDPAKGTKASGWIRDLDIRDNSLWAGVEFTEPAKQEILNKEWKYFSLEWKDDYVHDSTGELYQDVVVGGALTNRPVAKGMMPINFAELFIPVERDNARAFAVNKQPYGNVTYADPGYQKDGKKRYPLDTETHIRAAWSYINMPKNAAKYSSSQLSNIKSKIKAAMSRIGAKLAAEEVTSVDELWDLHLAEFADLETMEPGTNAPDPNTNSDDAAEGGWRRETPPAGEDGTIPSRPVENKGGEMTLEEELRQLLKLKDDDDILTGVKALSTEHKAFSEELEPLRVAAQAAEKKRQFAEDYPEQAKQFAELQERDRRRDAKAFAESLADKRIIRKEGEGDKAKDIPTTLGLSGLAIQKAEEVALAFAEGKGTFDDVKAFAEAVFDNGVVDYGSKGSSRTDPSLESNDSIPDDMVGVRKMFAEKVAEEMAAQGDKVDRNAAIKKAAEENPELFEKYQGSSMLKAV